MSSPSPVTDGTHVWVMTGVGVLKAFDFRRHGNLVARHPDRLRPLRPQLGLRARRRCSTSGALYVQVLHGMKTDDPSYLLKIDAATGKTLWRVERPTDAQRESPDSYTTPALLHVRRQDGDRRHGRRRRHRRTIRRPAHELLARDGAESQQRPQLPHRGVAARRRRPDHRAEPQQSAGGDAARRRAAT